MTARSIKEFQEPLDGVLNEPLDMYIYGFLIATGAMIFEAWLRS